MMVCKVKDCNSSASKRCRNCGGYVCRKHSMDPNDTNREVVCRKCLERGESHVI